MMKTILKGAVVVLALGYGQAQAFHSGGVAECAGCHTMHGSPSSLFLLAATDASSTCLNCHEGTPGSYHISTPEATLATAPPTQMTPGGDFSWLKRSYLEPGSGTDEPGNEHGHNIVAADFNYVVDPENVSAPGGTMAASDLSCTSCHDQHSSLRRFADGSYARTGLPIAGSGSYQNSAEPIANKTAVGVYRLLRAGADDTVVDGAAWPATPMIAIAPSSYNRSEAATQTRVAYGAGTGNWCAACHAEMHQNDEFNHPVDQPIDGLAGNYNAYVSSGVANAAAAFGPFTSLVPFNENTIDITTLKSHAKTDDTFLNGPATTAQVTCFSCHRAHASGFFKAARWNLENEFLTYGDAAGDPIYCGTDTTPTVRCRKGRTSAEFQAAYYQRTAAQIASKNGTLGFQRQLCNKCHVKD
jgi:predicted CXXCH cytochrome family protein